MKLIVREVMTESVVTVAAGASVDHAIGLLLRHQISGLPVVDDQQRLVGVVSERDLLGLLLTPEVSEGRVIDYATTEVITAKPSDSLLDVVDVFCSQPIRRLPVVDEQGRLAGVVSRRDLIRFIRDVRMRVAGELEKRRELEPV